jgi:ATP-dependent protease ClpP protease subunit
MTTRKIKSGLQTFDLAISRTNDIGTVDIHGAIYNGAAEEYGEVDLKMLKASLSSLEGVSELHVHIHSIGGHVTEGLAMFDELRSFKSKLVTYNDGIAASMGSVLFMAGDERVMAENSVIIIHNPYGMSFGEVKDHQQTINILTAQQGRITKIYQDALGGDDLDLGAMMDAETWIYAEDALADGWVHSVSGRAEFEAAAMITNTTMMAQSGIKNIPNDFAGRFSAKQDRKTVSKTALSMAVSLASKTPTVTTKDKTMNREELLALFQTHMALVLEFALGTVDFTDRLALVTSSASLDERVRIQGILALKREGIEDFVDALAFDDKHKDLTRAEAALMILDKLTELGTNALENRRSESNSTIKPDSNSQQGSKGDLTGDELLTENYANDVDGVRTGSQGFSSVENYIAFMKGATHGRVKHNNPNYAV